MEAVITPTLIDIDDIATRLGLPAALARSYLDSRYDFPIGTYHGRPLWLSPTAHDAIAEHQAIAEREA